MENLRCADMGSGRLQPSALNPGHFVPSGRVAHGLFSVRAWFWLVVAIKRSRTP